MSSLDYVEMTTTSIAGTSGDGAVTMTAISGLPTFTNAFGSSNRLIEYIIEDVVALKFERGVGTVSSNVLTRTTPIVTWNGTTYTSQAATAIQFGATPTSGNVRIRIGPTAATALRGPTAQRQSTASSRYASASHHYLWSAGIDGANAGSAGTGSATATEYYEVFYNDIPGRLVGFGAVVSTSQAASNMKLGLYEVGTDGLPGPCITRSNSLATTATGLVVDETTGTWGTNTGPLNVGIGWYYIGRMFDTASVALTRFPVQNIGYVIQRPPLGAIDSYGWGLAVQKTAENAFATGLPSGTPTGSYTILSRSSSVGGSVLLLAIKNN